MRRSKNAIVTFKADESLAEALQSLPNRSEFIRSAILAALDNACPLCRGTGILTPDQKKHWAGFAADHALQECVECHEWHLVCAYGADEGLPHVSRPAGSGDDEEERTSL